MIRPLNLSSTDFIFIFSVMTLEVNHMPKPDIGLKKKSSEDVHFSAETSNQQGSLLTKSTEQMPENTVAELTFIELQPPFPT